jgi:hypothetical protein
LDHELVERKDIGQAERAHLRVQAHAVDMAEAARDSDAVTRASDGYLRLRIAAGLTLGGSKPVDAFDALIADLAAADSDPSHAPNA